MFLACQSHVKRPRCPLPPRSLASLTGTAGPRPRFVNKRLFSHIQGFAVENGGLSAEVFQKAFGATEEEFIGMVQKSWPSQPRIVSVGSCSRGSSITTQELRPGDRFLIFASDELWEQLSDEAAVGVMAASLRKGVAMRLVRAAQLEAAWKKEVKYDKIRTIEKAQRRHFHDDITIIVLLLDKCRGAARSGPEDIDGTYGPLDVFSYTPAGDHEEPTKPVLRR